MAQQTYCVITSVTLRQMHCLYYTLCNTASVMIIIHTNTTLYKKYLIFIANYLLHWKCYCGNSVLFHLSNLFNLYSEVFLKELETILWFIITANLINTKLRRWHCVVGRRRNNTTRPTRQDEKKGLSIVSRRYV